MAAPSDQNPPFLAIVDVEVEVDVSGTGWLRKEGSSRGYEESIRG